MKEAITIRIAQTYKASVAPCQSSSASQYGISASAPAINRKNGG